MPVPKQYRYDPSGAAGSGCAINCITGARSFGKTYGWKKLCIKKFIQCGWTWGYLRTFDQEIKDILSDGPEEFFSDIVRNEEFPGYTFKLQGRIMMCGKVKGIKRNKKGEEQEDIAWKPMGQLFALTKAQSYKGKTVANMHYLIFDEFIRETAIPPYPQDCVSKLYSLWETLDRRENRIKIIMLANAADVVNPYYSEWGIMPPELGGHKRVNVGRSQIYVENCWNPDFEKYADESEIGKLTSGSSYSTYAQGNQFVNATGRFVGEKPRRCRPFLNIKWLNRSYCVYANLDTPKTFIEYGENPNALQNIALTREDQTADTYVIERSHPILKELVRKARAGYITYASDSVREKFEQTLKLCGFR